MARNRHRPSRLTLVVEDERTENFLRAVLVRLGFKPRSLRAELPPRGRGAAEQWVRKHGVELVQQYRKSSRHRPTGLVVVRDGDRFGLRARKEDFLCALEAAGEARPSPDEPIALLVPCWSIETWLLALLSEEDVSEDRPLKRLYEQRASRWPHPLRSAAESWESERWSELPSLRNGREELGRVAPRAGRGPPDEGGPSEPPADRVDQQASEVTGGAAAERRGDGHPVR